eukprot:92080-Amphidinium_carterae.1
MTVIDAVSNTAKRTKGLVGLNTAGFPDRVLVFCTFMRPLKNSWWIAFMCVGIDYLLGGAV